MECRSKKTYKKPAQHALKMHEPYSNTLHHYTKTTIADARRDAVNAVMLARMAPYVKMVRQPRQFTKGSAKVLSQRAITTDPAVREGLRLSQRNSVAETV